LVKLLDNFNGPNAMAKPEFPKFRLLKEWMIFLGWMVVLHFLLFGGWILLDPHPPLRVAPVVALAAGYVIGFFGILALFWWRLERVRFPPEYRLAHRMGRPASATVLTIHKTRWRTRSRAGRSFTWRSPRYQYRIDLRVKAPGGADYDTAVLEYIAGDLVPELGEVVPIKVHPERPEVVVLAFEPTD
jgi:hypothetical protein